MHRMSLEGHGLWFVLQTLLVSFSVVRGGQGGGRQLLSRSEALSRGLALPEANRSSLGGLSKAQFFGVAFAGGGRCSRSSGD